MKTITTEQLRKRKEGGEKVILVNTLPEDKFQANKIEGSINIPQDSPDFAKRVEQKLGDKSKEVVLYCASKQCDSSTQGAKKLDQAGFTNVFDFEAGAEGWKKTPATANR